MSNSFNLKGNILYVRTENIPRQIHRYNYNTGQLTNLGAPSSNTPINVVCNDEGDIVFVQDTGNNRIYFHHSGIWHDTGQTSVARDDRFGATFCINPDGTEVYYAISDGVRRWIRITNVATTIATITGMLSDNRQPPVWVDDNTLWVFVSGNTMRKIRISDGVTMQTSAALGGFWGTIAMQRSANASFRGLCLISTDGTTLTIRRLNNDGTWTVIEGGGIPNYDSLSSSRFGERVIIQVNATTAQIFLNGQVEFTMPPLSLNTILPFGLNDEGTRFMLNSSNIASFAMLK
jgi:hypothetical protein